MVITTAADFLELDAEESGGEEGEDDEHIEPEKPGEFDDFLEDEAADPGALDKVAVLAFSQKYNHDYTLCLMSKRVAPRWTMPL